MKESFAYRSAICQRMASFADLLTTDEFMMTMALKPLIIQIEGGITIRHQCQRHEMALLLLTAALPLADTSSTPKGRLR